MVETFLGRHPNWRTLVGDHSFKKHGQTGGTSSEEPLQSYTRFRPVKPERAGRMTTYNTATP